MAGIDDPKRHQNTGEATMSKSDGELSPTEYLREVKALLAKGMKKDAYALLQSAVMQYPGKPFLLSYFGYLTASLEGKYRNGIESCKQAILLFEKKALHAEEGVEERFKAVLYLNLGRAYIAGGKKKDGIETLQKGLRFDKQNRELLAEIQRLGIRKYVPLSFLDRSNPINVLVGRMFRGTGKSAGA
jgi:tetratricopeptide (TPR) repeat protein